MIQFENANLKVYQSALFQTISTVVQTEDFVLIVDPTWLPDEVEQIHSYVQKIRKGKQLLLLFTHSDYDHILGYGAFNDAQVIATKTFVENKARETVLAQIRKFDDEYYIQRTYPIEYPKVDIVINDDGQLLNFQHSDIEFHLAPGHNLDGLFALVKPLGYLIVGDYLSNVEFPYIYHSSIEYETTLTKAKELIDSGEIKVLIPGHGQITAETSEMNRRLSDSFQYIKSVRDAIQKRQNYSFEELMENYAFPRIMRQFHDANIKLIKKELSE
jgi:glyoxylase-like metal-dependent hydrolase (beta-lactamase superfamily II)